MHVIIHTHTFIYTFRSLSYWEALFAKTVRRWTENALVLFHPVDKEAELLCYNGRKALGQNIQITEERPNPLMCKKWLLARLSENKSLTDTLHLDMLNSSPVKSTLLDRKVFR